MKIPEGQKHVYDYYIDEHGQWFCEGNPVLDRQLLRMLSRSLFEEEGKYFLRCEGEIHPVRVADAPLWVRYVHIQLSDDGGIETLEIELTDGRKEELRVDTLRIKDNRALYCLATKKNLKARFSKTAYYELARYIEWDEDTRRYFVQISGKKYYIAEGDLCHDQKHRSFH
ncbi:DUF1285 domain-containing protein [Thermodesulforhabdus norvegica]|uniref:DUF1285 domain-containing protein n=1 Tax=Thermodesulforhabdus norvegica TaxID=39841 RepID=A0A1I4SNU8_9BACT|nr:DUF1285 domain-containing protein [Thermodesulforhabdus norvegica]SFM66079.1 Protein of unknown function [Thermodesulforhabdus norvegica]